MKRRIIAFSLVMVLILTVAASAVSPRVARVIPRLTFSGTTANCSVDVFGDTTSDSISVTLTLWRGGSFVRSWSQSGAGVVSVNGSAGVLKGQTYTLTATATVNGTQLEPVSIEGTC